MSPETRKRFGTFAVFAIPLVLVKSAAWFGTPAGAAAAVSLNDEAVVPVVTVHAPRVWTEVELAAAAYTAEIVAEPVGSNPMFYSHLFDEIPTDTGPTDVVTIGAFEVTVEAIMNARNGAAIALIDGTLRRIGESIGDGPWRITAIDARRRIVEFTNDETFEVREAGVPVPRVRD